ncbi:MAG TPA: hypothetical protein VM555_02620 [Tahibacter sp.]|jgi:hypothetical protein|nr:hypothetical protein [Tahibacter sp.]
MKLAAYTVADEATRDCPRGAQLERLITYARNAGDTIVQVLADDGEAARLPIALRRGGGTLLHQLQNRHVDGAIVVRLDAAFPAAGERLVRLPTLLYHLNLALQGIEPMLLVGTPPPLNDPATVQWARQQWAGRAPYGCLFLDGKLYRDPWTWATRDRIASLRLEIGLSFGQIRLCLERFGLRAPDGGRDWSTLFLRELVETHERIARVALRDPTAGDPRPLSPTAIREDPADYEDDDEPPAGSAARIAFVARWIGDTAAAYTA